RHLPAPARTDANPQPVERRANQTYRDPRAAQAETAQVTRWPGYPWLVLIASVLVQTSASFGNQAISPLAPFLIRDLDISRFQIGLLVTATYIGALFVLIPAGGLSDQVGVRRLFLLGPIGAGVALALAGV